MADSGYNWSEWADLTYSTGTDIDAIDVNDEATLTSDEFDLDGKAACEVAIKWTEGNDGAVDGDLYIYILGPDGEGGFQTINDPAFSFAMDVVQNATRILVFSISPADRGSFKILVDNDSGQDGDLTICVRTATIPVAS